MARLGAVVTALAVPAVALSSAVGALQHHQAQEGRACSAEETELEFLRRATGDALLLRAGAPDCVLTSFTAVRVNNEVKPPGVFAQQEVLARQEPNPQKLWHAIVHQSTTNWCAPPCNSVSWELAVPKGEKPGRWGASEDYTVFEIAVWQQLGRITAYQFDAAWLTKARNSYHKVCAGISWACAAYETFREGMAVRSCPSIAIAPDFGEDSAEMVRKMGRMLDCLGKKAGGGKSALTYIGHGSGADGSLFESAINARDGKAFVAKQDFAVLNFGTNCEEGHWGMVEAFAPKGGSPRFILASDLQVGGYAEKLTQDQGKLLLAAGEKLNLVAGVQSALAGAISSDSFLGILREKLVAVVDQRQQFWRKIEPILKRNNLHQSLSLYDATTPFVELVQALKELYRRSSNEDLRAALANSRMHCCDVKQFIKVLKDPTGKVNEAFKNFRLAYSSSRAAGIDPAFETHGFAFDIVSYASTGYSEPPEWQQELGVPRLAVARSIQPAFLAMAAPGGSSATPVCSNILEDAYTCDLGVIAE